MSLNGNNRLNLQPGRRAASTVTCCQRCQRPSGIAVVAWRAPQVTPDTRWRSGRAPAPGGSHRGGIARVGRALGDALAHVSSGSPRARRLRYNVSTADTPTPALGQERTYQPPRAVDYYLFNIWKRFRRPPNGWGGERRSGDGLLNHHDAFPWSDRMSVAARRFLHGTPLAPTDGSECLGANHSASHRPVGMNCVP